MNASENIFVLIFFILATSIVCIIGFRADNKHYWLARGIVEDNASRGILSHENIKKCDLRCRADQASFDSKEVVVTENLYKGPCDLRNAILQWQNSENHNKALEIDFDKIVLYGEKTEDNCYISLEIFENK